MPRAGELPSRKYQESDPRHVQQGNLSVLCVDGHPTFLTSLTRVFESDGWRVAAAATARDARGAAFDMRFDFMVIDLKLPDRSGVELVKDLLYSGITTPAMIVTGHPDARSAIEATKLNVHYVSKAEVTMHELVRLARARVSCGGVHEPTRLEELLRTAADTLASADGDTQTLVRCLADAIVSRQISFVDFMSTAEAFRRLLRPSLDRLRTSDQLRFLADRRAGRSRIAQAAGLERVFEASTSGANRPERATEPIGGHSGLGWSPRLIGLALAMRRAAVELVSSSEQVAQIAYRLGYDHHAAFDRHFRAFFGCSPTAFRRVLKHLR